MFLGEFIDEVEILFSKKPSSIYEVDYKSIVENLWKTNIAKRGEDIKVKKLISNVNIGLLEKGTNKSQKSLVFDTRAEALYHQNVYGARINKISGFYNDDVLTEMTDEHIKELERTRGEGVVLQFEPADDSKNGKYVYRNTYNSLCCQFATGKYTLIGGKFYDIKQVKKETEVKYYTMTMTHKKKI